MTKPAALHPIWAHRLVFPFRHGKLAAGLLIFTVMWLLLNEGAKSGELGFYSRLFFAAMCAYIVPVFSHIVERSVTAFDEIEGSLTASTEQCQLWRRELTHRSSRWFWYVSAFALSRTWLIRSCSAGAGSRGREPRRGKPKLSPGQGNPQGSVYPPGNPQQPG